MPAMIKVDFHTHSINSHDSLLTPQQLVRAALDTGLDKVAITDHNSIRGGLEAQAFDREHVIVGEEIMTNAGEILALFVSEEIPARLSPRETVERLRKQNAFISVSHPYDGHRSLWQPDELLELLPIVDALEVFNARCWYPRYNEMALQAALEHGLLATAGSDAHALREVGGAYMLLPAFSNAEELRIALKDATVSGKLASPLVHFDSRWAELVQKYKKLRRAG